MRSLALSLTASLALLGAMPAAAQDTAEACSDPQTTYEMRTCASNALRLADDALNADYKRAIAYFEEYDLYTLEGTPSGVMLLRNAQRAWIAYRDAACKSEAAVFHGGTLQPLIATTCHEQMTIDRSLALRQISEQN